MIRAKIQIEDGLSKDTFNEWGLIYKIGDRRFSPPEKKIDEVSYPEEQGVHIDERTVYDKFDYTVSFIISGSYGIANDKIQAFNKAIREESSSLGVHRCKKITLYDYYKRCKIVGYPQLLEEVKESDYRRCKGQDDFVIVDLTINVVNPSLCDFNLISPDESSLVLSLFIDDNGVLQWNTSRELEKDEFVTLLTCGRKRARFNWNGGISTADRPRKKSRNKWHVVSKEALMMRAAKFGLDMEGALRTFIADYTTWFDKHTTMKGRPILKINKAPNSRFILPYKAGIEGKICFALAVYKREFDTRRNKMGAQHRVSNVAYFYSNVKVLPDMQYTKWLSV